MSSWLLSPSDLAPFAQIDIAKAEALIEDATFYAALVAPCLAPEKLMSLTSTQQGAVKAILRGAILRWNEAGTGALTQQSAGPFSQTIDNRQQRRAMFWPSEITDLQAICKNDSDKGGAFSIDTAPNPITFHPDLCAFGCTCHFPTS